MTPSFAAVSRVITRCNSGCWGTYAAGPSRILELGAGTGNLSLALAERFPEAELVLLDASPDMLAVAEARLASQGAQDQQRRRALRGAARRARQLRPDYLVHQPSPRRGQGRSCTRRSTNGWLRAGCSPSPISCAASTIACTGSTGRAGWNSAERRENCHAGGDPVAAGTTRTSTTTTRLWAEHFRLLWAADFEDLDCVWRNWIWGIVLAHKS